jgi:hypothetical protein
VRGIDISVTGKAQLGKKMVLKTMIGYNYIMPKTLEPEYIYAEDFSPGADTIFNYITTSVDPSKEILKYRFLHSIKADLEFAINNFSTGVSFKYFSKIENLDKAIQKFEDATKQTGGSTQPIEYMDYFYNYNNGSFIFDLRISKLFKEKHKVSLIIDNILNQWYSLRPLKAEQMRKIILQYSLTF